MNSMIDMEEIKRLIIEEILIPSLIRLYDVDYENIFCGVSERNICARLAHHMENIMREFDLNNHTDYFDHYFADVEYNRMGNGILKQYENSEHRPVYMVSDLLIQSRGEPRNYLAVEMKRKGNYRNIQEDRNRLKSIVSSPRDSSSNYVCVHDTLVGAFIVYSPKGVKIELYEDVDGVGTEGESLYYEYLLGLGLQRHYR